MNDKDENVYLILRQREIRFDSTKRKDFKVLKLLICKGNRVYQKVSCKKSNKAFCYESGRLFSENYRVCHYGYGKDGGLREMYRIPKSDMYDKTKLEDALIYKCYHENFDKYDNRASLMALRSREMGESLVQYDLNTGQLVREIFLSHAVKFKYIAWAEHNELLYVKSVNSAERSRFHMHSGIPLNIGIVIAMFSAFPFKYVGMFEVDRRVFGPGITNAILTNGMLVVMYITGLVKFFSFEQILSKCKVFEHELEAPDATRRIHWGEIPLGLPINIKITESQPVLFEVRCADQNVQVGGFPWHYIYTPRGTLGMFEVTSLRDHKQVRGGTLRASYMNTEPDNCIFHGDGSGRILHVSGNTVSILALQETDDEDQKHLQTVASIEVTKPQMEERIQTTLSGRCIKKRQSLDELTCENDTVIHHADYEDELDVTWVSVTTPGEPPRLCFYDNRTLKLLRDVSLDSTDSNKEFYEYMVYVDLDTIVQVTKPRLGQFVCSVYRLSGDLNQENQFAVKQGTSHNHSTERQSGVRTSARVLRTRRR